jgi:hypothetical protein
LADFRPILQLAQQGEEQRDLPALFLKCTNSQGRKRGGNIGSAATLSWPELVIARVIVKCSSKLTIQIGSND